MTGGSAAAERRPPTAVPAGERGATRIADRVVAKIASQAAREALGARPADAGPPHATVVVHPHPQGTRAPDGTATHTAHVRVAVELGYPTDIGARCAAVRRRVTERVGTLAGMDVPEVAVRVERLHLTHQQAAVQGRTR